MSTEIDNQTPADYQDAAFNLLWPFVRQRSGLDPQNYNDWPSYRSEQRAITRDLHDFRRLCGAVHWREFKPQEIRDAFRTSFSGRLSLIDSESGMPISLKYCTGQYVPTEYRKAACAVLARLLWNATRESMPASNGTVTLDIGGEPMEFEAYNGLTGGDWMRSRFRNEFGRGLASRWFG